ncbi:MAG: type I restriction endonuclease subunit R [Candidatus Liberibacter asiaticus]|nr:type I restriction endonuclease subunit R [Candidatus Liberibacter asiaticus]
MTKLNIIAENPNSMVVADEGRYQSEAELEKEFIRILQNNGYEYLALTCNDALLKNLRVCLERLNNVTFSDNEWKQVLTKYLANNQDRIEGKTAKIHEDYIYALRRDDETTQNIHIIDKNNIHQNVLQIINQYKSEGERKNRYDVTILVNGLPLVHVELKRRGVAIREAFNQIKRYQRDSFEADSGLFEFVQLFVISNGTHTKYYSNTTRIDQEGQPSGKKTSNNFEFTSWWTDERNKRIPDLVHFAKTFFSKHVLLDLLTRYCVFTSDKKLLVMRPYQIEAARQILQRITCSINQNNWGNINAGGYIWHTTGSGKTLTSFKTAQLASRMNSIDKVLFVVDRKDLDYQTMKEYENFKKGSANSNTSTAILTKNLAKPDAKIIITTIQKLNKFISGNKRQGHGVFDRHIVIIFDECHRSNFGTMHEAITKAFKKYHIFGFTGTPIFTENATGGKTTEQTFGDRLHSYTITDAIYDKNVLPFRVDYLNTMRIEDGRKVIKSAVYNAPERIAQVTDYILQHFDQKTKRNECCTIKEKRLHGFNSIFAVNSIEAAKQYYASFKEKKTDLNIALIYSISTNKKGYDEDFDLRTLNKKDKESLDFLDAAIKDYNECFSTNFDTSSDKFENYYKDLSLKVKNREVDLLIVVDMFLTGFDAPTLNTLWVDKELRYHGLLQAFSRTNRIFNPVKNFGNIICFRNLEQKVDEALKIFGNGEASGEVFMRPYKDHYDGWDKDDGTHQRGYKERVDELKEHFPLPVAIKGEQAEKDFIKCWGAILRLNNTLTSYDEFKDNEILAKRDFQDYNSVYLDLYDKFRKHKDTDKEDINDGICFEQELVKQVTINLDYILNICAKGFVARLTMEEILNECMRAISSSPDLRRSKELLKQFVTQFVTHNVNPDVIKHNFCEFAKKSRAEELERIIQEENLKPEKTRTFVANAFRDGQIKTAGMDFAGILPPVSRFGLNNALHNKKIDVLHKLSALLNKYSGIFPNGN